MVSCSEHQRHFGFPKAFVLSSAGKGALLREGYEPKRNPLIGFGSMARSHSVPVRGTSGTSGLELNPFHSQRVQDEYLLDAARPIDLPFSPGDSTMTEPLLNLSGADQTGQVSQGPTGKGRGGMAAEVAEPELLGRSTRGPMELRTEGQLPMEGDRVKSMGPVNGPAVQPPEPEGNSNGLQRALEAEVVSFLRQQNSSLMDELEYLRGQLKNGPHGKSSSGDNSSPWSEVGGGSAEGSRAFVGSIQPERHGRHGSRTPQSKIREAAVSPERKDPKKFTPNGTRVPDGPPPEHSEPLPPVPPFPMVVDENCGDGLNGSFSSALYDTCESKSKAKIGDVAWKPKGEQCGGSDVLTPSEAKQIWMEREIQSLRHALDRVSIPRAFQTSDYWNAGFEGRHVSPSLGPCADDAGMMRDFQPRAFVSAPPVPSGIRAVYEHGEHFERDRAGQMHGAHLCQARVPAAVHGEHPCQARAPAAVHGEHLCQARASAAVHGEHLCQARASAAVHGEHLCQDRASTAVHGEHLCQGRASAAVHGEHLCQDRASSGMHGGNPVHGLHQTGSAHPCLLPGHGVGGGGFGDGSKGGMSSEPWPVDSQAGPMNTKGELADLPANSTPLQFGDWLHLIAPVMKDISGVAGWWWETTMREAKAFYDTWKDSTPLQRIQIEPRLPDALREHKFQRTEQRGIQMLLKAIPEAEQQALVTDRALSTTAILYKLLVRFQPGGAGEKQLLLSQLTSLPSTKSIHELAAAIRNWRRHFGRAQEVQAVLPDGVLLLKALDGPIQHLASLDPQAAFRLAQSRMQLQLDEKPVHENLWAFSQCLLAEAETLCLLTTAPVSSGISSPLKMKQLQGQGESKSTSTTTPDAKLKSGGTIDKPCKYWVSGAGCRAGKSCKWQHSWEGIDDKSSRCWICGGKDHIKSDCKLKASNKKPGEPSGGSGGGRGAGAGNVSNLAATSSTSKPSGPGGKAGAAAVKVTKGVDDSFSTATADNVHGPPEVTDRPAEVEKDDGRSGGSDNSGGSKTAELLQEATRLLKTLQLPQGGPKLKVMQLAGIDQADEAVVLIDSGATHALRPARDMDEWQKAERTTVQLAEGSTTRFRLKPGTKLLLSEPGQRPAWIIPMGGLAELDFSLQWSGNQCTLRDDMGRNIDVQVQNGCPMVSLQDGQCLLEWLELYHVHQLRKMMMIRTLLMDESAIDKDKINLELALTAKLRQQFPGLPDEVMMKLVPDLELIKMADFGNRVPWNRHKRRRLLRAKHVVIHLFSGPDQAFWDKHCASATTEVLCIDTTLATPANLHDRAVYGFLLMLCASGRVRAILGGPPCRTLTALRYQGDQGPGVVRDEEYPYGLPSISPADQELVLGDTTLVFRFWSLFILAEEVRESPMPPTQFFMEQPEDPARYRSQQDVQANKYFSLFRTVEWKEMAERYNLSLVHFDQFPMGHTKRKPTTVATNVPEMMQLDGIRGAPPNEAEMAQQYRDMSMSQRCATSKSWSTWAPGLKLAIATAISHNIQVLDHEDKARHAQVPPLQDGLRDEGQSSARQLGPYPLPQCDNQDQPMANASSGSLDPLQLPSKLMPLGAAALEQWKRHFLNDHMPARRDCAHCVRAQGRSKPHKKIQHPDSYTLSVDLSGKMSAGDDQQAAGCQYLLVGCYTYPTHRDGRSLLPVPGQPDPDQDQPLPPLDADVMSVDEVEQDDQGEDPLAEEAMEEEGADSPSVKRSKAMNETWLKLVEEAENVTVRQLTFVCPVKSRSVKHLLPALSRVYARLRALALPVYRIHSDRAREFSSAEMQSWALERNILTTMTSGSSFKANGRVESEMGVIKKSIRVLISSGACSLKQWPLAARHVGERRLRSQLKILGWPVGRLLRFGAKAYALRKSWQARYAPWREVREEVVVLGPDVFSSLTNTGYYVQSVATKRCFFTDDVIIPEQQQPAIEDQVLYLPEREEERPTRRLRQKTSQAIVSMLDIEGEEKMVSRCPDLFEAASASHHGDSSDSWSLSSQASSPSSIAVSQCKEEDWWIGVGDVEEAPNNQAGGSHLVASHANPASLRMLHGNLASYVGEELQHLDGTSSDQSLWLSTLTDAINMKVMLEDHLIDAQALKNEELQKHMEMEFLVTKTVGNQEVWQDLDAWAPSIRQEFEQLVNKKCAVRQITKDELRRMASEQKLPIEVLPGKMVHTRKSGTGAFKSRAVVCGNYASPDQSEHYAGGVDSQQVRTQLRLGANKQWMVGCTDIRTAFLNAPRRDRRKLVAMEIPVVFRKLGLATNQHIWLIDKALYGLTTSPRDWSLHRDEMVPQISWHREREGRTVKGAFRKTPDENVWRMEEVDESSGESHWTGLMSVYVDDLLFTAEEGALDAAVLAIEKVWAISDVEKTGEGKVVKYCGFEIEAAIDEHGNGDGFVVSQRKYEQEMIQRFNIGKSSDFPQVRLCEDDDTPADGPKAEDVKAAQSMAGALLWLSTRTRPDIAMTVAAACRLSTKNPRRSIEISNAIMQYIKGVPGGLHYPKGVPKDAWGKRGQLKLERHEDLIEVFSDIAFGVGSKHRSLQGLVLCYGGVPIAWMASQQPFVTYSTAEAELVSYGEALNAGRSMEALICAMMGQDVQSSPLERVIYGDNTAAIGMAHGTATSTWRTRHLRVRAAFLKEALDGTAPGGAWKLLHLRGTELVADGLTKPLNGQAFFKFLDDLGIKRKGHEIAVENEKEKTEGTSDDGRSAAILALATGSLLLSGMDGGQDLDDEDTESSAIWMTGAVLMMLGTIYAGQVIHSLASCCLRRLKAFEDGAGRRPNDREDSGDSSDGDGILVVSDDESKMKDGHSKRGESSSSSLRRRSGTSMDGGRTMSNRMTSSSATTSSSSATKTLNSAANSSSATKKGGKHFSGRKPSKGEALDSCAAGASTSMSSKRRSGSCDDDAELDLSLTLRRRSGSSTCAAAGDPAAAAEHCAAAASESIEGALDVRSIDSVDDGLKGAVSKNPWNQFQHTNKGRGLNSTAMSRMYHQQKVEQSGQNFK